MRTRWVALSIIGVLTVSAFLASRTGLGIDYGARSVTGVEDAAPQVDALAALDIKRFVKEQTALGPVSVVIRAPFAALEPKSDEKARYRLGAWICLAVLGLAGISLASVMYRRGSPAWHCGLVVGLLVVGAPSVSALAWGHPEELLATAFVLWSALLAHRGKARAAGAVAGLALATKPWALLALPGIALAAGYGRMLLVPAIAAAVGLCLILPPALADTSAFRRGVDTLEPHVVLEYDIWWPMSNRVVRVNDGVKVRTVRRPRLPSAVLRGARPFVAIFGLVIALLLARRGAAGLERGMLVLAIVFLVRCLLDPLDAPYYHVPFIAATAAWEGLRGRPPLLAIAAAVLLSNRFLHMLSWNLDALNAVYLAWGLPVAAFLLLAALRARRVASPQRTS